MRYTFQSQLKSDTRKSAQRMMTERPQRLVDSLLHRFFDPNDLQGMLPDSVNVNDKEAVEKFLNELGDVFADILLTP